MKKYIRINMILLAITSFILSSCNDFLDRAPLSEVSPKDYLNTGEQLLTYTSTLYPNFITTHSSISGNNAGTFILDNNTDNQGGKYTSIWTSTEYKVPTDKGDWNFKDIRKVNYFFNQVMPKFESGKLKGSKKDINQAIGEAYFFRALGYFEKLKNLGDVPIVKDILPDNREILIEKSARRPQNEVARFILSDLDKATELLQPNPVANKNRVSKEVAQLIKSRVALYEGTWLKHHRGTAFVPGGPGWPGAKMYPNFSLDIDSEIDFFLREAMKSAEMVADRVPLTPNQGGIKGLDIFNNPYFMMFSNTEMSQYSEVLLWKSYNVAYGQTNVVQPYLRLGANSGYTRGFVDSFLMEDGLPIYASSEYKGDDYINDVLVKRDERLQLFMKGTGDVLSLNGQYVFDKPNILDNPPKTSTGYDIKKGIYPDALMMTTSTIPGYTGSLVYRATEAYLNYIEAQYELDNSINAKSLKYWKQIRARAGVDTDIYKTINNTDLTKENDWGAYSKGQYVDKTLYNIRRERRCELIAEGFRMDDLRRWRALDQVNGYQVEGFKLWGPMKEWYGSTLNNTLKVSPENLGPYLRLNQKQKENNLFFNGLVWMEAHYWSPISFEELQQASPTGDANDSKIYQNPGWPTYDGGVAEF